MKTSAAVDRLPMLLALVAVTAFAALGPTACGGKVVVDGSPSDSAGASGSGSTGTSSTGTSSTGTGPAPMCLVTGTPSQCPSAEQVFEMLIDPTRGACSEGVCHGESPGSDGVFLPKYDINQFFQTLYDFPGVNGEPYINADDPTQSWMYCNLAGLPGGGKVMPPGGIGLTDPADVALVKDWILCGAVGP
jgi:hypothetical protein